MPETYWKGIPGPKGYYCEIAYHPLTSREMNMFHFIGLGERIISNFNSFCTNTTDISYRNSNSYF